MFGAKQLACFAVLLCLAASTNCKPLVKRPPGSKYKTILSVDAGALRGIIPTMVLIELEDTIKRHLVENPEYLPEGVATVDDFDINLVDYFDLMTGCASGSWLTMYLATRGGKGAAEAVFNRPDIYQKYGRLVPGEARGLRVFYHDYGPVMYPPGIVNLTADQPFDLASPLAPGVLKPVFTNDGLLEALEAFLGDSTLDDLEVTYLVPAVDLYTDSLVMFLHNEFRDEPVSTSTLFEGTSNKNFFERITVPATLPGFDFVEKKNYYLREIATGCSAVPVSNPALQISQVGSTDIDYYLSDAHFTLHSPTLAAALFLKTETKKEGFSDIAVISIGNGDPIFDLSSKAEGGMFQWLDGLSLFVTPPRIGRAANEALEEFLIMSSPNAKPNQYLRIQLKESADTPTGKALTTLASGATELTDTLESAGKELAELYSSTIDSFVQNFILG